MALLALFQTEIRRVPSSDFSTLGTLRPPGDGPLTASTDTQPPISPAPGTVLQDANGQGATPEDLRAIHRVKTHFDGEVLR